MAAQTVSNGDVFHQYLMLHPSNYQGLLYLVQENQEAIEQLDPNEAAEMRIAYFEALHELQEYDQLIAEIDPAIEAIIRDNVLLVNHVNAYEKLLFLRAISCLKVDDPSCQKIARALVRMNPDNAKYEKLLHASCFSKSSVVSKALFAIGIAVCFLAIAALLMQQMIVRPFYAAHAHITLQISACLFLLGPLLMLSSEVYTSMQARYRARKLKNS